MTDANLKKARATRRLVTQPPPWTVFEDESGRCAVLDDNGVCVCDVGRDPDNSAFIAAAPTLVTSLLREVARLKKQLAQRKGNRRG